MATSKKAEQESKDLATQESKELAALYGDVGSTGFEDTTSDDYAIPFLKILQKNSPEVDPDDGAYIEGAKPGLFVDTSTGELFENVHIIPCLYRRAMVEWKPRDEGGGFVAQHEVGVERSLDRDESGRFLTRQGTYIADTRYFFCLRLNEDGTTSPVVVSFTSTQIKKSRAWLTTMSAKKGTKTDGSLFTYPMFSHVYRLSTVSEQNEKGSWRGYKIDTLEMVKDPNLVRAAMEAMEMFRGASDNVKPPEDSGDAAASASATGETDDDIPF